eukprot:CAMPEP_0184343560 /NCGR_PEP_ID=MMETSP1089-20130417/12067_1 /TAXON_ID=38269 ORGANISM="Gloeochaete wittrockiana, Strain SAG46.84" /NCGR_SAMPLE_ID=MMETSP1089 /ASSEMBLY_ACC=CAM_ASM_000445 /LENGTH=284 /DNA_ID=CAMNT_0026672911 /DNA_START=126 /DNA_END=977 /DNA_ORIENTATION=-
MADLKTRGGAELERDPEDLELVKGMMRKVRNRNFLFQIVAQLVAAPGVATIQPFMLRATLEETSIAKGSLYPADINADTPLQPLVSWKRWGVPVAIHIAKSVFEHSVTSILLWFQPQVEDDIALQVLQFMRSGNPLPIIPVVRLPPLQNFLLQVSSAVLFFKLEQASLFLTTRDGSEQRSVLDLWGSIGFSSMALVLTAIQGFHSAAYKPWATLLLAEYINNYDTNTLANKTNVTERAKDALANRTLTTFLRGFKVYAKALFSPQVAVYYVASGFVSGAGQMYS